MRLNYFNFFEEFCVLLVFVLTGVLIGDYNEHTINAIQYSIIVITSLSILIGYGYSAYTNISDCRNAIRRHKRIGIKIMKSNTIMNNNELQNELPQECQVFRLDNSKNKDINFMSTKHFTTPQLSRNHSSSNILEIET